MDMLLSADCFHLGHDFVLIRALAAAHSGDFQGAEDRAATATPCFRYSHFGGIAGSPKREDGPHKASSISALVIAWSYQIYVSRAATRMIGSFAGKTKGRTVDASSRERCGARYKWDKILRCKVDICSRRSSTYVYC